MTLQWAVSGSVAFEKSLLSAGIPAFFLDLFVQIDDYICSWTM
jgi:hypothetical protein